MNRKMSMRGELCPKSDITVLTVAVVLCIRLSIRYIMGYMYIMQVDKSTTSTFLKPSEIADHNIVRSACSLLYVQK